VYFEFHLFFLCVKDPSSGAILLQGPSKNGLYPLCTLTSLSTSPASYLSEKASIPQWHARLRHPALRTVKAILSKFHLAVTKNKHFAVCHTCQLGKSHKLPFHLSTSVLSSPFQLLFMDVWGPLPTEFVRGNKYYLSIIDDFSKFIWLFPLNAKSQVAHTFINFQLQIERYFDCKIKSVQTDFGDKFQALKSYLLASSIVHRLSCPHTYEQNGLVERRHRHIVETGLTLMANASVPQQYWNDAFLIATYLINRLPSPIIHHKTPLELMFKQAPDYTLLRTFGCTCWPYFLPYNSYKMDYRSTLCVFLGYKPVHQGYQCLQQSTGRIFYLKTCHLRLNLFPILAKASPLSWFPNPSLNAALSLCISQTNIVSNALSFPRNQPALD